MIFSSCGQYFATYTGNKYIVYNSKSLKAVKEFELDNFVEDVDFGLYDNVSATLLTL